MTVTGNLDQLEETAAMLREAAQALARNGFRSPVLQAAIRLDHWNLTLVVRVSRELQRFRAQLPTVGIDPALLPKSEAIHLPPHTADASAVCPPRAIDLPEHLPQLSAAATLALPSSKPPLQFDGTLDGLRGVPVDDLIGLDEDAGVSADECQRLTAAGIASVYDLLLRIPLRYVDRSEITPIAALAPGMKAVATRGKVLSSKVVHGKSDRGRRGHALIQIGDQRHRLTSMQFNAPWMAARFQPGDLVLMVGDVTEFNERLQMPSALIAPLREATTPLVAIYPQSDKHDLSTWTLARACLDALRRIPHLDDPLPEQVRDTHDFPSRLDALRAVHVPETHEHATAARDRLAYDELLRMQLAMGVQRHHRRQQPAITHKPTGRLTRPWLQSLPWPLTGAQRRCLGQIADDLRAPAPTRRMLQGDVGSGKTFVLTGAALSAVESGHQAALMAPLGVLVHQHYEEIAAACAGLGVRVALLPSASKSRARREVLAGLASGEIDIVVGTTGLLSDDVVFRSLGLAIVDEQHRFGVEQRAALVAKAPGTAVADELGATATPIPRTAAMTVFGDTDLSILDEMPPGRTPIATSWIEHVPLDDSRHPHWQFVRAQVGQGRQGFVVCPLVAEPQTKTGQESEAQAATAIDTAAALGAGGLSGLRVEVVTGRQKTGERSAVMAAFAAGEIDVLVATTVIEVGVSVANATTITILDAARFGLAQLHQLRGRVGRGKHPGSCVLTGEVSDTGRQRIDAMCATTNGFELAEIDYQIRGPGALAGTGQAGHRAGLVVADLIRDAELMKRARVDAGGVLAGDPLLERRPTLRAEVDRALGAGAHHLQHS